MSDSQGLTLLTIPLDVREEIIQLLLLSLREPYTTVSAAEATRQPAVKKERGQLFIGWSWYGPCAIRDEEPLVAQRHDAALTLQLVNHQLNEETRSVLARRRSADTTQASCSLDVLYVNEAQFWPTWISPPLLPTVRNVREVSVTFRIFGGNKSWPSAWRGGDGGPPPTEWCFYHLLERFLRCGPHALTPERQGVSDKEFSIGVLIINVSAEEGEPLWDANDAKGWYKQARSKPLPSQPAIRPEWVADKIAGLLMYLLGMSYHSASFGTIVHERIGKIKVLVDGVPHSELNPGDILSMLDPHDDRATFGNYPQELRLAHFKQWKEEALRLRAERGFE